MELREIIKILKNNLKLIVAFMALGGLVAAGVIAAQPAEYRGDFAVYLNKTPIKQDLLKNYNDFYALQSLSNVADFLVEWSKSFDAQRPEFDLKIKKKTALYLEGYVSSPNELKTTEYFNVYANIAKEKISELNGNIFADSPVLVSFSDLNVQKTETNFWRWIFAGIFGGFILGIFAVFLKHYFKN